MGLQQTPLLKVESHLGGMFRLELGAGLGSWDMVRARDWERVRFRVIDGIRVKA